MIDDSGDDVGEDDQGSALGPDETPNAADPKSVNRQRRRKKQAEDEVADFWVRALSEPIGRKVTWDLLDESGFFKDQFAITPSGYPSNEKTWFHLGQKQLGQRLYHTLLRHAPEQLSTMLNEHHPDFAKPAKPVRRTANHDA